MTDHDDIERRLAGALGHDPDRQPPSDRIARIRAEAAASAESLPPDDRRHDSAAPTRRRDLLIGGIAASIGAAAGVAGGLLASRDDTDEVATEPLALSMSSDAIVANGSLINHTWGVELLLDIDGLPAGDSYTVEYRRVDGTPIAAGSFLSVDAPMKCRFNAAVIRRDTAAIRILGPDGTAVVAAELDAI